MDLNLTPEELTFRDEVRAFLRDKLPEHLSRQVAAGLHLSKADTEAWHAILNERGWLAAHWPVAHGGTGWSPVQKYIFELECAIAHAPRILAFGLSMLGPVLIKYGSEAQKARWLPRILNGSDWWCQGYSEPGAGSDLASLKTTAVRDGDHYVVNGQKTWTTLAQHANMIFCLVRTDPAAKKQSGISFLLIDMKSAGVELRPIIMLDRSHQINEVFLTDVRVPVENLVGEENRGWDCAKYLLTYERTNIAGVGHSVAALDKLVQAAASVRRNGRALIADPAFATRLARVEIELENMKTTNLRVVAAAAAGEAPGAESSMLKIRGSQIQQDLASLLRRAMGPHARPFIAEAMHDGYERVLPGPAAAGTAAASYFNYHKHSIYGGSNEIQRNIISKTILGL